MSADGPEPHKRSPISPRTSGLEEGASTVAELGVRRVQVGFGEFATDVTLACSGAGIALAARRTCPTVNFIRPALIVAFPTCLLLQLFAMRPLLVPPPFAVRAEGYRAQGAAATLKHFVHALVGPLADVQRDQTARVTNRSAFAMHRAVVTAINPPSALSGVRVSAPAAAAAASPVRRTRGGV